MYFYEKQHFGDKEYFLINTSYNLSFPLHFHRCFEFVCCIDGEMDVRINNKTETLTEGKAVLIFPNQLHAYETRRYAKYKISIFTPELIGHFSSRFKDKVPESNLFCPRNISCENLDNIFCIKGFLYQICGEFIRENNLMIDKAHNLNNTLLHKIFLYIDENYGGDCLLHNISKKLGYDYAYLSKYFIKQSGISFKNYLMSYRINAACMIIDNSDTMISQIALECGYNNLRTFNRNFKQITGQTPTEYKNKSLTR